MRYLRGRVDAWCRALEAVKAAEEDRAAKDAEVEQLSSQLAAATADQQRLAEVESAPFHLVISVLSNFV